MALRARPASGSGISKAFFFEKKKQKLLCPGVHIRTNPRQRHKSLFVLFFRKELLSSSHGPAASAAGPCVAYWNG
jgi:hypothetical protein